MRTIVMTGGTSGFGAVAADRMLQAGELRLIRGGRRPPPSGESVPLELSELDSVRAFARTVRQRLDDARIDALVLNAGMIRPDDTGRTVDGFETTFAVNHLAHHLLLRLLLPSLAERARVVVTTSGTHDPRTGAGLTPPRHADAGLLAYPEHDPDRDLQPRRAGEHAYTASKLCAVLTARSLMTRGEIRDRDVTAIAFCPGQVFGTGLADHMSVARRIVWAVLGSRVLARPLRRLNPFFNSPATAGAALADLALGVATPPPGHVYAALRGGRLRWPDPSDLARDDVLAQRLWDGSERLATAAAAAENAGRVRPTR